MNKKCTGFKLEGSLLLSDNLTDNDYQILDVRGQLNNLTLGLFTYLNKPIKLKLTIGELELKKEGVLLHREMKIDSRIKGFIILHNGIFMNLDRILWDNVGELINIELELIEDSNYEKVTVK